MAFNVNCFHKKLHLRFLTGSEYATINGSYQLKVTDKNNRVIFLFLSYFKSALHL